MILFLKTIVKSFIKPFKLGVLVLKLKKKHKTLKLSGNDLKIQNSKFGKYNYIENAVLSNSVLNDFSYVGNKSYLKNVTVGKFTCIGPNVKIGLGEHPTSTFVSVHPMFYSKSQQVGISFVDQDSFKEFNKTLIGHDVWIGANVIVRGGVKIGNGAIIASGSIVTKNVSPYQIVGGVPAKVIKKRFDEKEIDFLLDFKWWDKDINWLKDNIMLFQNIKNFYNDKKVN